MFKTTEEIKKYVSNEISRLTRKITNAFKEITVDDYFDLFSNAALHDDAARLKAHKIMAIVIDSGRDVSEMREFVLNKLVQTSRNPLNCTSPTVNVMQVYELSAWSDLYRELF